MFTDVSLCINLWVEMIVFGIQHFGEQIYINLEWWKMKTILLQKNEDAVQIRI